MNKKGSKVNNAIIYIGVFMLVAIVALGSYAMFFKAPVANSGLGDTGNVAGSGSGAPTSIVTGATTLTLTGMNALQTGTTFTGTTYIGVNGGNMKTGVTSADQNDKLELLMTNTSYHAGYFPNEVVPQGKLTFIKQYSLYKNASVSVTLFNTNNIVMTSGTTANQSVTAGQAPNIGIRIDGVDKASTNPMRCILESSNTSQTSEMVLTGFNAVKVNLGKPNFYTLIGSSSGIWVYDIDAITGAVSPTGTITPKSVTGISQAGVTFKISCYSKENFIDSLTGKIANDIVDSDGSTTRYLSTFTATGYLTS